MKYTFSESLATLHKMGPPFKDFLARVLPKVCQQVELKKQ